MKSLIMGLLASKLFKTPVISRLEVHHYVTKYVPVTHTTTLLVGKYNLNNISKLMRVLMLLQ
jgi:hypothetical protein